jgi:ribonuclease D
VKNSHIREKLNRKPELASAFETFQEIQGQLANKFGIEQERNAFIANLKTIASNQSETNRPKVVFLNRGCTPWQRRLL